MLKPGTGEKVLIQSVRAIGRQGRSRVQVVVVGWPSLAWVEAAELWGASVEGFIVQGESKDNFLTHQLFPTIPILNPTQLHPPCHNRDWSGALLATIASSQGTNLVAKCIDAWNPTHVILAVHGDMSRREAYSLLPTRPTAFHEYNLICRHDQFGGVTTSKWRIQHWTRDRSVRLSLSRMTTLKFHRVLQTALDDTLGAARFKTVFEKDSETTDGSLGKVITFNRKRQVQSEQPVYPGDRVGPDISRVLSHHCGLWVMAESVYSEEPVLRQLETHELNAVWDYAGKLWVHLGPEKERCLLRARIRSPPAKVTRSIVFTLFEQMLRGTELCYCPTRTYANEDRNKDRSSDPTDLELKAQTRVEAKLADDVEVDLDQWAIPGETKDQADARIVLRRFAVRWWFLNLEQEAWRWWRANGATERDREAIEECLFRAKAASYWEWHRGSQYFFWRFPNEWLADFRDGVEFCHLSEPPKGHFHNIPCETREAEILNRRKIFRAIFRGYIEKGFADLITPRFSITKTLVPYDIRTVWDCKRNGLNATLWARSFMLPTFADIELLVVKWLACSVLEYLLAGSPAVDYTQDESVYVKSYQFDIDVGEHFHNTKLHKKERHSQGVVVYHTDNRPGAVETFSIYRWRVPPFGATPSPYIACQAQKRIMELCKGHPDDPDNPFQWAMVWVNPPASDEFDPSMPRIMLLRKDGEIATQEEDYVDDVHGVGRGEVRAATGMKRLASKMNSYGNQDSPRKRRKVTCSPGAWNGAILSTDRPYPTKSTTVKKWNRFVDALRWMQDNFQSTNMIDTAELRRIAGIGVDITDVYPEGRPYLKGFYNAMEAFRGDRDVDGWRLQELMDSCRELERGNASQAKAQEGYPAQTNITNELQMHVEALRKLFSGDKPRVVPIRPQHKNDIRYFIGDASAEGFGAVTQYPDLSIEVREGLWEEDFASGGSNLREMANQVNNLKRDIQEGKHDGCELWMVMDNSTWSAVWTKGMSSVPHLFYAALELKVVAYEHGVTIRALHISGKRMIAIGVDGVSRGDLDAGVMLGYDARLFLPLDISAFDVMGNHLELWCKSWMGKDYSPPLKPRDWFWGGHKAGVHVWAPPPGVALIVLKELAKAKHKRPYDQTHVVLIPRLLYQEEWRRRFEKEMDLWFAFETGSVWPHSAFEPLIVGISFPLYRDYPWEVRMERDKVVGIGRALCKMSKNCHVRVGDYLRQLWGNPRALPPVPECLVR